MNRRRALAAVIAGLLSLLPGSHALSAVAQQLLSITVTGPPVSVSDIGNTGVTYASRTNTTLTAPSGIQNGDVLIIYFLVGDSTSGSGTSVTPPSGFTAVPGPTFPVTVTDNAGFFIHNYTWYKIANSESGNYTITHASASTQGWIVACRGADTTTPFGQSETSNPQNHVGSLGSPVQSSTTANGITTTRNGCLIIFISQDWGDLDDNLTGPSGYTKQFGATVGNGNNGVLYAADLQQSTAGATGNQTITNNSNMASGGTPTTNSNPWSGFLIAVQPPVGGAAWVPPRRPGTLVLPRQLVI